MNKIKIAILGASGMLGSMLLKVFSMIQSVKLVATVRNKSLFNIIPTENVEWKILDAENCDISGMISIFDGVDWVINAIGMIKPYIHNDNPIEVEKAIKINSLFPYMLSQVAEKLQFRVIQIATDCVYSGSRGNYEEGDPHYALDVYGKTKSLGEVQSKMVNHLRCSIIGPELRSKVSLMEWFLSQPQNTTVNGFTNHLWNGITTLHFSKICSGIISNSLELPHLQHIIPKEIISKSGLLRCFANEFGRNDIIINPIKNEISINRTLASNNIELNNKLWKIAGYDEPPTITQMLKELILFMKIR